MSTCAGWGSSGWGAEASRYQLLARDGDEFRPVGTSSPFNIKVESIRLRNFNADEVTRLYEQHSAATGQQFTAEAKANAFEFSQGQPWLVNALAYQAVDHLAVDPRQTIDVGLIEAAKEELIRRRDTHLDSLVHRLREPRVRRVLEPVLSGEILEIDTLDDDVAFAKDLGLITSGPRGLEAATPIYREIIPRVLTGMI